MPPKTQNPWVTPRLFRFLRDLKKNNEREWFQENKDRYESAVREPLRAFIDDFAEPLYKISPHFRADSRKVGGSLPRPWGCPGSRPPDQAQTQDSWALPTRAFLGEARRAPHQRAAATPIPISTRSATRRWD